MGLWLTADTLKGGLGRGGTRESSQRVSKGLSVDKCHKRTRGKWSTKGKIVDDPASLGHSHMHPQLSKYITNMPMFPVHTVSQMYPPVMDKHLPSGYGSR